MAILNEHFNTGLTTPARRVANVTPDDANPLAFRALTVYVTVGGTIKFDTIGDDTVTMTVPDYYEIPAQITKIYSTGTTATGIVAYG